MPCGLQACMTRRLDALSIGGVADRGKAAARHRNAFDRRRARLALLDRGEGTGSTQREAGLAVGERRRMLARHHLSDLARFEICHFNLTADHVDGGLPCVDGDAELRAL